MEAESSVNKVPGLSAPDSHGIRFLVTTPTCRDAVFMVAASQTPHPHPTPLPSIVKEQLVAAWQLIYYDDRLRLVELLLLLGRSCL